jgi:RNA polymerase sigma factor (sigma-70 family)
MTPDPADQVSDRDAMLTALRSLSPRQRACVVLRYYEDLPVAEVAAVLGVGDGTVKRYLSEAMPTWPCGCPARKADSGREQGDADR